MHISGYLLIEIQAHVDLLHIIVRRDIHLEP